MSSIKTLVLNVESTLIMTTRLKVILRDFIFFTSCALVFSEYLKIKKTFRKCKSQIRMLIFADSFIFADRLIIMQ